jgi:hypothetical protein
MICWINCNIWMLSDFIVWFDGIKRWFLNKVPRG